MHSTDKEKRRKENSVTNHGTTSGCRPLTRRHGSFKKDTVRAEKPTLMQAKVTTVDTRVSELVWRAVNVIDPCGLPALDNDLLVAPAYQNTQWHQEAIDCATSLREAELCKTMS